MEDSLVQRLERVEAELAIRKLVSRYMFVMDNRDVANIGGLFTRDAYVWSADGVMNSRGREALVDLYKGRFSKLGATNHFVHDVLIDLESNRRAKGLVSAHAEVWRNNEQQIAAMRYADIYEVEDGAWRIAERKFMFIYYTPVGRYPNIFGTMMRNLTYGDPIEADAPEKMWRD